MLEVFGRLAVDILTEGPSTAPQLPDLYEVVDGEIKERQVGARQVFIAFELACFLREFARPKRLGHAITEMLFHLRDGASERRPDAAFISSARWPFELEPPSSNSWSVVPDLAVEVISPSNTYDEIRQKINEYFEAGVIVVWVVSTIRQEVEVFQPGDIYQIVRLDEVLKGDPVLLGFELPLKELFSNRSR
jgi:Uma2 family endonuclease